MDAKMKARLEADGWTVGGTQSFLGLSDEDMAIIDMKLALAAVLKAQRAKQRLTQVSMAKMIHSTQSRVAKMEAADQSVSLDALVRSFLKIGGTRAAVATALCG